MPQTIQLVGVIEDGSDRSPLLPRNTATTILLPQFAPVKIDVLVRTAAGAEVDLTASAPSAASAQLTFQRQLDPCQRIPELKMLGAWAGAPNDRSLLRFGMTPAMTRQLDLGRYFFDVWLTLLAGPFTGRWQIVGISTAVLQAALQRA